MSERYLSELAARLWALYKKERNLSALQGVFLLATLWASLFVFGFLLSLIFVTTGWAKFLFLAGAAGSLVVAGRFLLLPSIRKPSAPLLAKKAEAGFPELEDRLISAFELAPCLQNPRGFSPQLVEAVIGEAYQKASGKDFTRLVDRRPLKKAARTAILSFLVTGLLSLASWPVFKLTLTALAHPFSSVEEVLPYQLFAKPEGGKVPRMKDLEVRLFAVGKNLPGKSTLHYRYEGGSWHPVALKLEKTKGGLSPVAAESARAAYVFKELRRDIEFYFASSRAKTKSYRVEVVDVPYLTHLRASVRFPAYTGLPVREGTDNDGNIGALTGSKVTLSFEAQKPLKDARLVFGDGKTLPARVENRKGAVEFALTQAGRYKVVVVDRDGNANVDPIEYEIRLLPDEVPQVEITQPGADRDLTEQLLETLTIEAKDDFGFSALKLFFAITSERAPERKKFLNLAIPEAAGNGFVLGYGWDLSGLRLNPGDVVSYYAEAADNDRISGPKKAQSQTYRFRLPSLDEMIAEAAQNTEENLGVLAEAAARQKEILEKFKQKSKELLQSGKLDWETKKQLGELAQKQSEMEGQLARMEKAFAENLEKMQENQLLNQELAEKMQELAELWEKVATPEMKERMKKLTEALEKLDPELLQRALEELNLTQEQILKNLERSIELLKRMALEQKMDALLKQAERVLEEQRKANKEAEGQPQKPASELAQMEKKVKEDLEKLEKKAAELKKELDEKPLFDPAASDKLTGAPSQSGAKEKVAETVTNFAAGRKKEGEKSGAEAEDRLEQMLSDMRAAKERLDQSEKDKMLAEMNQRLNDLLTLSERQEELSKKLEERSRVEGASFNETAQEQKELAEQAQKVSAEIEKLAKKTLFLAPEKNAPSSQCLNSMNQAVRNLNGRNPTGAIQNQKEAYYQLNQAARQMVESMKQCQSGQTGSGMKETMQKMQGMCDKQGGINAESEKLMQGRGEKPTLSPEELGAYGRLRVQEREIQRDLDELRRQYQERKNVLGRLDELATDFDKLVEEMERGPAEGLLKRQARVLNRMLDFQRSLQTQREEERRKAQKAVDVFHLSPADVSPDAGWRAAEMESRLKKFLEEPHPPEYQEAVRDYFEALKSQNLLAPDR
ncbi:MAG: hypothetical protein L0196_06375 [candidate division Zixibacteria bacterium]|nr:hypothetical protein [candidate division Zixibacteria bacterium]